MAEQKEIILFVGGIADGRRLKISRGISHWDVPLLHDWYDMSDITLPLKPLTIHTYVRFAFGLKIAQLPEPHVIMLWDKLTSNDVLHLLISRYPEPKEKYDIKE